MKVKVVHSTKQEINDIILDLKEQLEGFDARLIQFYASSVYNAPGLSEELYHALGGIPVFGCTTSGEIVSGKMLDHSVVLMAFSAELIQDCKIEVLENISTNETAVDDGFISLKEYLGTDMNDLNPEEYVGIVLIDGMSGKEEAINERIGDLTNVTFIGGSAGDDLQFKQTFVFANGKAYTDAAVICLIKSSVKFGFIKTQSFRSTGKKVVVTKAHEASRTILEFNGKPAVEEYAQLTGVESHNVESVFSQNPVGLVFENDFFVRSPQKVSGSNIVFYCAIKEGMELDLLQSQNIIEDTKEDLENKIESFGRISAIINFNCILRTLELKDKKQTKEYGKLFEEIPTVGFSTYGERYISHINQTAAMLIFGE